MKTRLLFALFAAALAACDAGPKAVATHAAPNAPVSAPVSVGSPAPAAGAFRDPRDAPVPDFGGKPLWSANKQMTAEQNAQSHFERDGADFGAATRDDYVAKAHAFTAKPPKGALKITRPNGDRLIYDPKANVFAVATRAGAPRTMFKPHNGMAYWQAQVRKETEAGSTVN